MPAAPTEPSSGGRRHRHDLKRAAAADKAGVSTLVWVVVLPGAGDVDEKGNGSDI